MWLDGNNKLFASLSKWVPSQAIYKQLHGKSVEGRHDYLDVTFPKTGLRIPARLVRTSDTADVALIKIDVPESMQPIEMSADDPVSAGDNIIVMGYPGISPDVAVQMNSQDRFNREGEWRQIPEPTVTGGNIGKVILGSATTDSASVKGYFSEMGDAYQLTVTATGSGNSGGPVFNDKGHTIGIFTSKKTDQSGTVISFAVPIKYGQELMGVHKLVQ
jgi:S1-C subfamily serine protease